MRERVKRLVEKFLESNFDLTPGLQELSTRFQSKGYSTGVMAGGGTLTVDSVNPGDFIAHPERAGDYTVLVTDLEGSGNFKVKLTPLRSGSGLTPVERVVSSTDEVFSLVVSYFKG